MGWGAPSELVVLECRGWLGGMGVENAAVQKPRLLGERPWFEGEDSVGAVCEV